MKEIEFTDRIFIHNLINHKRLKIGSEDQFIYDKQYMNMIDAIVNTNQSRLFYGNRQTFKTTTMLIGLITYALKNEDTVIFIQSWNKDNISSMMDVLLDNIPRKEMQNKSRYTFENNSTIILVNRSRDINREMVGFDVDILALDEIDINQYIDVSNVERVIGTTYFPIPE